jgi:hypothetical protein
MFVRDCKNFKTSLRVFKIPSSPKTTSKIQNVNINTFFSSSPSTVTTPEHSPYYNAIIQNQEYDWVFQDKRSSSSLLSRGFASLGSWALA